MNLSLYRAVAKDGFTPSRVYHPYPTPRAPSNVPYVVDNLLEMLRPADMPSRRHAAYASPTPELALTNASAAGHSPSDYLVCTVAIIGDCRIAQLPVTDARYHPSVRELQRLAVRLLGDDVDQLPLAIRLTLGAMFTPLLTGDDMRWLCEKQTYALNLIAQARELSTFWQSASLFPQPDHDGELFFDLAPHASYTLQPLG